MSPSQAPSASPSVDPGSAPPEAPSQAPSAGPTQTPTSAAPGFSTRAAAVGDETAVWKGRWRVRRSTHMTGWVITCGGSTSLYFRMGFLIFGCGGSAASGVACSVCASCCHCMPCPGRSTPPPSVVVQVVPETQGLGDEIARRMHEGPRCERIGGGGACLDRMPSVGSHGSVPSSPGHRTSRHAVHQMPQPPCHDAYTRREGNEPWASVNHIHTTAHHAQRRGSGTRITETRAALKLKP